MLSTYCRVMVVYFSLIISCTMSDNELDLGSFIIALIFINILTNILSVDLNGNCLSGLFYKYIIISHEMICQKYIKRYAPYCN